MVGTFGDKFRTERERKGLTLDEVSNVTKINTRMLKAIEAEQFDQLPGGVFNKGFIRAYAKHLGFDDEESVSEYLVALRQAQVDQQTAAWQAEHPAQLSATVQSKSAQSKSVQSKVVQSKPVPSSSSQALQSKQGQPTLHQSNPASSGPLASVPPALESGRGAVAPKPRTDAASAQLEEFPGNHQPGRHEIDSGQAAGGEAGISPSRAGAGNASTTAWRIAALILAISVVGAALWNRHSRRAATEDRNPPATTATANTSAPASSANDSSRIVARPSSPPSALPSRPAIKKPIAREEADTSSSPTGGLLSHPAASARTNNTKPIPALTLGIRASENCWISVIVDGETVSRETLIAPAHTSIRARREIIVKVGNAAAVTFLLNGKEFPAEGGQAEVKTFIFDATGMRVSPPTPQSDLAR
jgi:cytoskeletal protein RodZ